MEKFEKVERLVEKTGASYEDAKKALEEANDDMLDAMIILEKQGKIAGPGQNTYSTAGAAASQYKDVPAVVNQENKGEGKSFFKDLKAAIKRGIRYTTDNYVKVERRGDTIIKLPLWISIIILLAAWHLLFVVFIISLFCECKYSIEGKDDASQVNVIMDKAAEAAEKVKDSFKEETAPASNESKNPYAESEVVAESDDNNTTAE